ncbi:MAG TPA: lysylphosphatidylglycerol synthase transmembrane domain-containing protein [Pyrinomonadaceae bacterium]|nr:lysylphosphatidylglycerol synthase transmembrane domain-containing protein [Pyrinomonadaceae bacterium]
MKTLSNYRKIIEFAALLLLAAAIIWLFGRKLDWQQVKTAVRSSDWRLILIAVVIILLAYLWRVVRWQALLKPLTETSIKEVWIATCVGFAAVLTIGRAGEVVRPVALPMRDRRVRPAASFVTIMIERLYDTMTVVLMFSLNLLWFKPTSAAAEFGWARIIGFSFLSLLVVGVAFLIWFKRRSAALIDWLDNRIPSKSGLVSRVKRGLLSTLEQLATALSVLSDARLLGTTIFWSFVLWGSVVAANMLVCRAFGIPFGISQIIFVLGWSMVGSVVPTPGGAAGAFHAATAAALILLGVGRDQAAAIAIIMHLVDFGPAAVFGVFYFLRGDVNLTRLRTLMSVENVEHAVEDEPVIVPESA